MRTHLVAALALCLAGCTHQLGQMSARIVPPTVPLDCGERIARGEDCQAEIPAEDPARSVRPFAGVQPNTPISRAQR